VEDQTRYDRRKKGSGGEKSFFIVVPTRQKVAA
jgi:hypothetical protein